MSAGSASELWRMCATELAAHIRSGQASSREVVEAHLSRIEAVDPAVNAIPIVLADDALRAADRADRTAAEGQELPPFHGVPFTIKGNIDVVGTPTTQGARALTGALPSRDAPVVERLRAAGAIPIGQTNLPTYALRWHTESELWGATINPWDRSRTPGASSGGEAAAIATGMSPLGLGNDTLGSLRWPAQCCGVAALKPTLGRIPDASTTGPPALPIGAQLTTVQGPMARRISDLRTAFETLAGPTWRDPWTVPAPLRGPPLQSPIHVAVVTDPAGGGTARQVQDGVRTAGAVLERAGYHVHEVEPPDIDASARVLLDMIAPPVGPEDLASVFPSIPEPARRFLSQFYEVVGPPDPGRNLRGLLDRYSLLRAWAQFQEVHPLIVAPVYTEVPFLAGTDIDPGAVAATIAGMRMTLAVSALGLPAVVVPVGIGDGLPQVVQVIGPRYREDLCLDAAEAIEAEVGMLTPIDPR